MTEAAYQAKLMRKIKRMFPGVECLKNDPNYQQGILDWTLLYGNRWAMLEVKADSKANVQPNQKYFMQRFNDMSFAAFVCPENEEEVLAALQKTFSS